MILLMPSLSSSIQHSGKTADEAATQGTLALVGSGEFPEPMRPVDRVLLERCGGGHVAILPTASAPDGPGVPEHWVEMGAAHFRALGAQAEGVLALKREDCDRAVYADAVSRANLVYFSGGKPDYLYRMLQVNIRPIYFGVQSGPFPQVCKSQHTCMLTRTVVPIGGGFLLSLAHGLQRRLVRRIVHPTK